MSNNNVFTLLKSNDNNKLAHKIITGNKLNVFVFLLIVDNVG